MKKYDEYPMMTAMYLARGEDPSDMPTSDMPASDMPASDMSDSDTPEMNIPTDPAARVALLRKLLGEPACRQLGIFPVPPGTKLSIVIPVFNEERWLPEVLRRVKA